MNSNLIEIAIDAIENLLQYDYHGKPLNDEDEAGMHAIMALREELSLTKTAWQAARQTKKLIWAKSGDEWVANTGFGVYIIRQNKDGYWDVYLDNGISELWLITEVLVTLDDAVAFANADFHERVLGCLVNGGV